MYYLFLFSLGSISAPCPPITPTKWLNNAITVAGGHGKGASLEQFSNPYAMDIDIDGTIYVADYYNSRIMAWKSGDKSGRMIISTTQPTAVLVNPHTKSLIISEQAKKQVIRLSLQNERNRDIVVSDIRCLGMAIDKEHNLYIADHDRHEIRRFRTNDKVGTLVAGGNGVGHDFNQLQRPWGVFVDQDQSVYVADYGNHRVMKWEKNAREGIVVAGGNAKGNSLRQLCDPEGVCVDSMGSVYVADYGNNRVIRWLKDATEGTVIVGGNGQGTQPHQLSGPLAVSFDRKGNLYVADYGNHRIQRFDIE